MIPASAAPFAVVLTPADLATVAEHRGDLTILDVRAPAEFESAHIPGSYNVPLENQPFLPLLARSTRP